MKLRLGFKEGMLTTQDKLGEYNIHVQGFALVVATILTWLLGIAIVIVSNVILLIIKAVSWLTAWERPDSLIALILFVLIVALYLLR